MTKRIDRRIFVGGAAGAGGALLAGASFAGAASGRYAVPTIIRAQNAPVEIDFYHIWGTPVGEQEPDELHPSVRVINLFNESQPDVRVNSLTVGGYAETLQKAQAELAAGKAPALVITPWAQLYFAEEGLGIQDLGALYGEEVNDLLDLINPVAHPLVTTEEGAVLGVPYAFSTPIWYVNTDIFNQAGVDPVAMFETWETFAESMPALQAALGGNPVFSFASGAWPAQTIIQSNGGKVLDAGVPVMNGDLTQGAMQVIAALDADGYVDSGARPERRPNWLAGVTAIHQASVASLRGLRNDAPFEFMTLPYPVFEGKERQSSVGGSFIGMYAREKEQQDAAWEFMKFALSEEAYAIWMEVGYLNVSTYDLPIVEGQEAAYTQFEEGLTPETQWPSARGAEASSIWDTYVDRMWANDISVEEGTNAAVEEISAVIGL